MRITNYEGNRRLHRITNQERESRIKNTSHEYASSFDQREKLPPRPQGAQQPVTSILPLLLLLVFFAFGMAQVRHASITFDEGPHLAVGYATLRTGDFRLQPNHIHPPLANVIAAAPLLLQNDLPDPRTVDGWGRASLSAITDAVVWQYPHPARIATAGRVPLLLASVLLAALIYRWAKDIGGRRAALLALTLFALDPNCIAHSALITTDSVAALLIVAALYTLNRQMTPTLPHTHTPSHPHSLTPTLPHTHTPSHPHSLTPPLSHTHFTSPISSPASFLAWPNSPKSPPSCSSP